jgi:hypothetical protein
MDKFLIILYLLVPKWELLLDHPTCLGNDAEKHIVRDSCSIDICSWKKDKTVLIFVSCNKDEVICYAYRNGINEDCDKYEEKVKF